LPGRGAVRICSTRRCPSDIFAVEAITDARDGEDKARMSGIGLNLAAQLADVDVEIMGIRAIAGSQTWVRSI